MADPEPRSWRLRSTLAVPLAIVATAAVAAPAAAAPVASATTAACRHLTGGPAASPGATFNNLAGVTMLSECNVWAVGAQSGTGSPSQTVLVERWNGTAWKVVKSPSPGTASSKLTSVSALSASSVWAVGQFSDARSDGSSGPGQTLTEHWNGSAWKVVPSPNPGDANLLTGVKAVSANDVWAVGYFANGNSTSTVRAFIEHWDGTRWRLARIPNPGTGALLNGVAATSRKDAWAVGYFNDGVTNSTLILHWNGTAWKRAPSPNPDFADLLEGVSATSAKNAWAVGVGGDNSTGKTLILRWDGHKWTRASSPNPGGSAANLRFLFGVAATSASNAWATGVLAHTPGSAAHRIWSRTDIAAPGGSPVGSLWAPKASASSFFSRSLLLHWNGTEWTHVPSPSFGDADSTSLDAVTTTSASSAWVVGSFLNKDGTEAMALHCC
jgi:hypothetical protein